MNYDPVGSSFQKNLRRTCNGSRSQQENEPERQVDDSLVVVVVVVVGWYPNG